MLIPQTFFFIYASVLIDDPWACIECLIAVYWTKATYNL